MDFLQLAGKTTVVFGMANRKSVAFHVARLLEEAGATVLYVVRSDERRQSVASLVKPGAKIHICDVEHEDQIARLRDEIAGSRLAGVLHSIAFADYGDTVKPFHETP